MIYKGYEIEEVYKYTNGTSDFEIFKGEDEHGTGFSKTTLETVKQWIDGMTE